MAARIDVGGKAPDFEATTQEGETIRLSDLLEQSAVVLFFYPKDETPICTAEACSFRDRYEDFRDAGAAVLGVSGDGEASHRRFAEKHRLPFLLVSDPDRSIRERYGVPKTLGFMEGRVTFVIDQDGVVKKRFQSALKAEKHVREALDAVRRLN